MHHRIFLCAAFLLFSCGCRNGSLVVHGETVAPAAAKAVRIAAPVKPIVDKVPVESSPCARAVCPMIYCPNSLPAIPSQGICCPRCVTSPSCNTSACPTYKCAAGIQPANLTGGECCDRCAPITKTTATARATQVSSSIKTRPSKESSSSSSSSSSESESSSSSDSSSDSDESHGKVSGNRRRLPCFIHKFKGKHDDSRIIRKLRKSLARYRHRAGDSQKTGDRLLIQ